MKTLFRLLLFLAAFFCASIAFAGDAIAAAPASSSSPWLAIIPLVVPGVVALVKVFLPKIPRVWLPIMAASIGLGLALLDHFTGALGGNPTAVAFLGAAGTGIREIYDQVKAAAIPTS